MYQSAQNRFLAFCREGHFLAVPASLETLCHYVSHLADSGLKHRTIKAYLSAIRFLHIAEGAQDPFRPTHEKLEYILRGIKRCESEQATGGRERLPITPSILKRMKEVWEPKAGEQDTIMIWAACCVAFFGFLRAGEFTVPSDSGYDPAVHLSKGDIALDNPRTPTMVRITIKQSKTDLFRKGINLFLGKTSTELCPVTALLNYLVVRGKRKGPLFIFEDGRLLTRQRLVEKVREALAKANIDQASYCGHSFRIGAATTAASRGLEDSVIKTLGRWRSLAYLQYIKIPRNELAFYSRTLGAC